MLRLVAYLILLVPVTYGALWLAERPGQVTIEWQGYEISMALGILAGLVVFATVIVLMLALILRSLLATPARMRQRHRLKRYEQGLRALNRTMTALALADHKQAEKQLRKSRYYLSGHEPITQLLGVQLAHAAGKREEARAAFDAMLEDDATRPVALRGKIMDLMRAGEYVHARDFAEEAWQQRPHDAWLCGAMLDLLFRARDWAAIEPVIDKAERKHGLSREQAGHYRAELHTARAREALKQDDTRRAQELGQLALKHGQRFLPARLVTAQALARQGETRSLLRFLEQSWALEPHPAFAELFLARGCQDSAGKTQKRLNRLIERNPDHLESQIVQARTAMLLAEWEQARNALKVALSKGESPRIYQLLAQVEIGETGDDKQAAHWLALAVQAPREAQWLCGQCGELHDDWQTHCRHCGQFDAIIWSRPDIHHDGGPPLLAGAIA